MFISLAVALGYAFAAVPNIELVSLTLAFAGFYLGTIWGGIVSMIGFGLYSLLSPYGLAPPPLLISQLLGGFIIGSLGSLIAYVHDKCRCKISIITLSIITGFIGTLLYDILTNIGSYILIASKTTFLPFLIGGLGFSTIHIISNTVIFGFAFPLLIKIRRVLYHS